MDERERRERVAEQTRLDPHAPLYHFVPPEGSCRPFDPNGAIFWKGRYHLFYIFQDATLPHGGHCWGHASSADLLHWEFHPTALAPRDGEPDLGIYSGGAFVNKEGLPTIIYHGVGAGTCIATAEDDGLVRWRKSPHNPVIPVPAEGDVGWGVYNVFDPHAWVEGEDYYAILGGKVKPHDLRDTAYLFRSKDLIDWEYLSPFYKPNPGWTGEEEDCACPDFFRIGDRHALLCISHSHGARYYLGRYLDGTFVPEEHHRMNWAGGPCFAPESLLDDKGRRIMWAWAIDQRKNATGERSGLGVMTLPRVLSSAEDGSLRIEPPVELRDLRRNRRRLNNLSVDADTEVPLEGMASECIELALEAEVPLRGRFTLKVRSAPGGAEETLIVYDHAEKALKVDSTRSSSKTDIWRPHPIIGRGTEQTDVSVQVAPFEVRSGERLTLRVFLDRSMLEVFANGRQCITQRIYPDRSDSIGAAVLSEGGPATIRSLDVWGIASINTC